MQKSGGLGRIALNPSTTTKSVQIVAFAEKLYYILCFWLKMMIFKRKKPYI